MPYIATVLPAAGIPTSGGSLLLVGANFPISTDNFTIVLANSTTSFECLEYSVAENNGNDGTEEDQYLTVTCVVGPGIGSGYTASIVLYTTSCKSQQSANVTWGYQNIKE